METTMKLLIPAAALLLAAVITSAPPVPGFSTTGEAHAAKRCLSETVRSRGDHLNRSRAERQGRRAWQRNARIKAGMRFRKWKNAKNKAAACSFGFKWNCTFSATPCTG